MPETLIIHTGVLIDQRVLAAALPAATAQVMAAEHGLSPAVWEDAYRLILNDWESYWADLDLGGDESLAHWREGRWRVIRALFRLVGLPPPPIDRFPYYLDEQPRQIARLCHPWRVGAVEALRQLTAAKRAALVGPYLAAAFTAGLLDSAGLGERGIVVIGPDQLERAGLPEDGRVLALPAGSSPDECLYIGPEAVAGMAYSPPPDKLDQLATCGGG